MVTVRLRRHTMYGDHQRDGIMPLTVHEIFQNLQDGAMAGYRHAGFADFVAQSTPAQRGRRFLSSAPAERFAPSIFRFYLNHEEDFNSVSRIK